MKVDCPLGAVGRCLPGVTVTVTNAATAVAQTVVTDDYEIGPPAI